MTTVLRRSESAGWVSPFSSGKNFGLVVNTAPSDSIASSARRSARLFACVGGWRSSSRRRGKEPTRPSDPDVPRPSRAHRAFAGGVVDNASVVEVSVPTHLELQWPTLQAVEAIGGSGTIGEIDQKVVEREGFTEEQQSVLSADGRRSKIEYRLAWARTYLKGIGALDNSARGVWALTDEGRTMEEGDLEPLVKEYRSSQQAARQARKKREAEAEEGEETVGEDGDQGWKERLLGILLELPPDRFEHLARRLLREAGFTNTKVTGRSGDGGIDGLGVYRLSLVSFPVFFQCKRYRGSVRAGDVRDFRGAMAGRGDRGLLITTGAFTADARQEATREGAPPIDLIDGERLCELLKEHNLGVRTVVRQIEDVEIVGGFFEDV